MLLRDQPHTRMEDGPTPAAGLHQRALHLRDGVRPTFPAPTMRRNHTRTAQHTSLQPQTTGLIPPTTRPGSTHLHMHSDILAPTHTIRTPKTRTTTTHLARPLRHTPYSNHHGPETHLAGRHPNPTGCHTPRQTPAPKAEARGADGPRGTQATPPTLHLSPLRLQHRLNYTDQRRILHLAQTTTTQTIYDTPATTQRAPLTSYYSQ